MSTIDIAHKQWASRPADERFTTLAALADSVRARKTNSVDGRVDLRQVEVEVNGNFTLVGSNRRAILNHWTAGQLLSQLAVPRDLLARLDPKVAAAVVNNRLTKAIAEEDMNPKQRVLIDNGTSTVRAFHGRRYEPASIGWASTSRSTGTRVTATPTVAWATTFWLRSWGSSPPSQGPRS